MNIQKASKKNINEYKQEIKNSGFRLTGTRMTILETFLENRNNLSAEEVFLLSHRKYPKIGQATVYRNLKLFKKEGVIEKAGYENNRAVYRLKAGRGIARRDKDYKQGQIKQPDVKKEVGINKNKEFNIEHPLDFDYESTRKNYADMERINAIQNQLTGWLGDLKKVKREKERALEDAIKDFGKVDKIINNHDNQRSDLIQILLDIQNEYRWLPKHVLMYISSRLDVPLTNIYDITTFYKYFNLEPQGKHSIIVCMGTACHVRGATKLLQRIVNILGIKPGDTTDDYNFTLNTVNCIGCCALGPVMMIDNKYFSNPSTAKLKKILKQFQ